MSIQSGVTVYRWCIVPNCRSTSIKTPEKTFIQVPRNEKRRQWLLAVRRNPQDLSKKSNIFVCENHFDLENDMENYMQWKLMGDVKILMKQTAIPHKFDSQPDKKRITSITQRSATKQIKQELVEGALSTEKFNNMEMSCTSDSDSLPVVDDKGGIEITVKSQSSYRSEGEQTAKVTTKRCSSLKETITEDDSSSKKINKQKLDIHSEHNPAKRKCVKSSAERPRSYQIRKRLKQALFNISQGTDGERDLPEKNIETTPAERVQDNKLRKKLAHSQIATKAETNSIGVCAKDDSKPSTSKEKEDDAAMECILESLYERLKTRGVDAYPLFNSPVVKESNSEANSSQELQIVRSNEVPLTTVKVESKLEDFEEIEIKNEPIIYRNDNVDNKKILVDKATEYEVQEITPKENSAQQSLKINSFGINEVPPLHWIKCSQTQPTITTYQHAVTTKNTPRPLGEEFNTSQGLQIVKSSEFPSTVGKVITKSRDVEEVQKSLPILYTNDNMFESDSANGGSIKLESECDDIDIFFKRITQTVKLFPKSLIFEAKQRIFEVVQQLEEEIERGAFLERFS